MRYGDLHSAADADMQPLRDLKIAEDHARCNKGCFLACKWAAIEPGGVLFNLGPDVLLDTVGLQRGVPNELASENYWIR